MRIKILDRFDPIFQKLITTFDAIATVLEKLLDGKKTSEEYIIMSLPLFLFSFLSYQYLIPYGLQKTDETKMSLKEATQQAEDYKIILDQIKGEGSLIVALQNKNIELKKQIKEGEEMVGYINTKIDESLDKISYSGENWSQYLNEVAISATKNKVFLSSFNNTILETAEKESYAKIFQIDINSSGNFSGLIGFLRELDKDERISSLELLKMQSGEKEIQTEISIGIWGMR